MESLDSDDASNLKQAYRHRNDEIKFTNDRLKNLLLVKENQINSLNFELIKEREKLIELQNQNDLLLAKIQQNDCQNPSLNFNFSNHSLDDSINALVKSCNNTVITLSNFDNEILKNQEVFVKLRQDIGTFLENYEMLKISNKESSSPENLKLHDVITQYRRVLLSYKIKFKDLNYSLSIEKKKNETLQEQLRCSHIELVKVLEFLENNLSRNSFNDINQLDEMLDENNETFIENLDKLKQISILSMKSLFS